MNSKNLSWPRFFGQFIKDLRLWVYLILLFQYFHLIFSIRFISVPALTPSALVQFVIDHLATFMQSGVLDALIAGVLVLPYFLLVSLISFFVNIELSARYLRAAYTLKLSILVSLINAAYYLYFLFFQQTPSSLYNFLYDFARLNHVVFINTNWLDWIGVIAMIVTTVSFSWFIACPWINRGAYVVVKSEGRQGTFILMRQLLFFFLILGIYALMMIFMLNNLNLIHFAHASFMNKGLINPLGMLLHDLITYYL